jgi:hypothetical protein
MHAEILVRVFNPLLLSPRVRLFARCTLSVVMACCMSFVVPIPKVQAAVKFAKSGEGKTAIITSLFKAVEALEGRTGTRITL